MTVEAQTPQGIRTASSVYEVFAEKDNMVLLPEAKSGSAGALGQAVVLDITGGPVFVLMAVPPSAESLARTVTQAFKPGSELGGIDNFLAAVRSLGGWSVSARAELPRADWPTMVRFRGINDPKSVEEVDPDAIGVKQIVVETTRDPVTTGINQRLPWLDKLEAESSSNVRATSSNQLIGSLRAR